MLQEFVKATIEERERSIQESLRDRQLANAREARARSGCAALGRGRPAYALAGI
jgi:hypothetical protein